MILGEHEGFAIKKTKVVNRISSLQFKKDVFSGMLSLYVAKVKVNSSFLDLHLSIIYAMGMIRHLQLQGAAMDTVFLMFSLLLSC